MSDTKASLSAEFERRLLNGLHLEWETARASNPDSRVRSLTAPLFALNEARGTLALWNPKRREIVFSRHFITHHPWDAVREVLLHEMAHQVAHETLHAKNEPPHGPAFLTACEILGATPKASGSFPSLRERLAMGINTPEDAVTQRIHKLFALSESSNPHESEAALAKARLLMEKYHIDTLETRTPLDEYTTVFLGKPGLRHHREYYALANLLTEHYFVRCIWAMAYVMEKDKMGRVLEVSGARSHVLAAEYVYHFVLETIDRAWKEIELQHEKRLGRYRKSDYAEGLIEGFSQKLRHKKNETPSDLLPELVADPVLDTYIGRRYPRVTTRTRRANRVDADLLSKGMEAGKRMSIRPGVAKKAPKDALITE